MKIVLSFIFVLYSITLGAQYYDIKKLGFEKGISSNYILSITQDKKGFLWFATEYGLNRFDGNKFKPYYKDLNKKNKSITGNELNKVYADHSDNKIWIATQREGLNVFDCETETFHYYRHNPNDSNSIITNDITDISLSSGGNFWISTYHKGIEFFDKKKGAFIHYNKKTLPGLGSDNVWSVIEDNNDNLYIGHVSSGLSILSLKDKRVINFTHDPNDPTSLPGNEVRTIYIDKANNVWIGTNNGLALYNEAKKSFTVFKHNVKNPKPLISNSIYVITQLNDERLWIGTEAGGISILNIGESMFSSPENISFQNIPYRDNESGLSNQTVRSIYQDSFNNIWIGTYGGGVNFIGNRSSIFKKWEYSSIPGITNSLNNKTAWGICADKDDNLWIGTDGGGINLFEEGKRTFVYNKEANYLTDNAVLTAMKDSWDNLWFGTFTGGINIYNSKNKTFSSLKLNNGIKEIRCFFEDEEKNIWIGADNGLYKYNFQTKNVVSYTTQNSEITENIVRSVIRDDEGKIWVGFFGQGLSVYDADFRQVGRFYTENGFPSNMVNDIYKDSDGNIWVATSEGLVRFSSFKVPFGYEIFDKKDGVENSYIRAITDDLQGNIWISTNGGISCYYPSLNKFYNYNHFDGLPMGNFMSGSVTKTSDGTLYFGSQDGLCYFNPASISTENMLNNPTVITEIRVYDNRLNYIDNILDIPISSGSIELKYNQNTFSVSFNVLDYSLNHTVEYSYMLKGLEDIWYNTQGDNSISFRNIPPGTYELLIKSKIKNQDWSNSVTTLKIVISPPFWLSIWAKLIYFVISIAIIVAIILFYKRKLILENSLILEKENHQREQDLNNERLRFFTNITHELRTPLTLILGPLEDMNADRSLPEKYSSKISVIYKSSIQLLHLINQILEFRKTETQNKKLCVSRGNLSDLVQEVGLKYKELNTNKKITFDIVIETQSPLLYFDSDIITTIINNLLSNAFKYTDTGSILLILRDINKDGANYKEIEVKDTGRGISEDELPKIFNRYYQAEKKSQSSGTGIGLALVQNLVKLHQGIITTESKFGEGTSFKFSILTDNFYPDALHTDFKAKEQAEIKELADHRNIILVVEDNEDIRNYIKSSFQEHYKVYTADNGKKGIELAFEYIPDIIVSDIMMPETDGFELSKILKKDIRTSHIPIILLTAKDTIQDRTEGYAIGVESYITKPFSASLLQSRIANLLEARKKMADLINNSPSNKKIALTDSLSKLDNEFIEQITTVIEENIDSDKIDVVFLADKMFMSHSTLYRKIKGLTGITANEFIRKIRIKNAEKLLLTGKYTISEISFMVGFNSINYFRQCFKEEFGFTPSEYVKNIMNTKGQDIDGETV